MSESRDTSIYIYTVRRWWTLLVNTHNRVILVFFRVMAICSDRDYEFSSALQGLTHNPHRRRIQCVESMGKWPCDVCFTFYSLMMRDDVLIKNNKYGYVTMQNNGAMKIVNFTHALMAETRRSFLRPWMPGMRLVIFMLNEINNNHSHKTHNRTNGLCGSQKYNVSFVIVNHSIMLLFSQHFCAENHEINSLWIGVWSTTTHHCVPRCVWTGHGGGSGWYFGRGRYINFNVSLLNFTCMHVFAVLFSAILYIHKHSNGWCWCHNRHQSCKLGHTN